MKQGVKNFLTGLGVVALVVLLFLGYNSYETEKQKERDEDWSNAIKSGRKAGQSQAYDGWSDSIYDWANIYEGNQNYSTGYLLGFAEGYGDQSYEVGYEVGYQKGLDAQYDDFFEQGYEDGTWDGYHEGYDEGYYDGYQDALAKYGITE